MQCDAVAFGAVYCSVLQCVAVCAIIMERPEQVLQRVAVCCGVLRYVRVCANCGNAQEHLGVCYSEIQFVTV